MANSYSASEPQRRVSNGLWTLRQFENITDQDNQKLIPRSKVNTVPIARKEKSKTLRDRQTKCLHRSACNLPIKTAATQRTNSPMAMKQNTEIK